jgi:hypothetical protein
MPDQHQALEAGFRLLDSGRSLIGGATADLTAAAVRTRPAGQRCSVPGTWRMGMRMAGLEAAPHAD